MSKDKQKTVQESIAALEQSIFAAEQVLNSEKSTKFEKVHAAKTVKTSKLCIKALKKKL